MSEQEALLSTAEVAIELGCSAFKVGQLVKAGLPCVALGRSSRKFRLSKCIEWLESHSQEELQKKLEKANPSIARNRKKYAEKKDEYNQKKKAEAAAKKSGSGK